MKKILTVIFCLSIYNFLNAQISDDEAKHHYQNAEDQFETGNFYNCYQLVNKLMSDMGKSTPKTLYLEIKAIYNNLENKNDNSVTHLKKNYKNYSVFNNYCEIFFSQIDKNNYPVEKQNEIASIQQYFQKGLREHELEKDRIPKDAIDFLNECAKKFPILASNEKNGDDDVSIKFSLDSSYLRIDVFAKLNSSKKNLNSVARGTEIINLSKVWLVQTKYNNKEYIDGEDIFYPTIGNKEDWVNVDSDAPIIMSTTSNLNQQIVVDNIFYFQSRKFNRDFIYSDEEYKQSINSIKASEGFYLYHLFNYAYGKAPDHYEEFKKGNYKQRIYDAFEFLIEYYGGGTPIENIQESKSKF